MRASIEKQKRGEQIERKQGERRCVKERKESKKSEANQRDETQQKNQSKGKKGKETK